MGKLMLTGLSVNGQKITSVSDPTTASDAATKNYVDVADVPGYSLEGIKSTYWYAMIPGGGIAAAAATLSREVCFPLMVSQAYTLTGLAVEMTVAGASSHVFRAGMRADASGIPGTLLHDFGTVVGTAIAVRSSGWSAGAISVALTPGTLYWITGTAQVGTVATYRVASGANPFIGMSTVTLSLGANCYYQSTITGALPSTFTIAGSSTSEPRILVQLT